MLLLLADCQTVQPPYDDGKRWGMAEPVESGTSNPPGRAEVAMDPAGNAIAVWSYSDRTDGIGYDIWANRYTPGVGWGTEERIGADEENTALRPQVAMDPNGDAITVWQETEGTRFDIWSNRYTAGVGWGTKERIETDDRGAALVPQLAMDPSGNAVAVWQHFDGTRFNIWANRYTPDEGWARAEPLETDDAGDAVAPQIAVDPTGSAIVVWQQSDGIRDNIWSKRYTPNDGWGTLQPLETNNLGEAEAPQIAMDAEGNGVAVWRQSDGERFNISASRYMASDDRWSNAERIETDDAGDSAEPQVAVSADGTALAVWVQFDGNSFDVWSNRLEPDRGWDRPKRIDRGDLDDARTPHIAMNARQSAVAVWIQAYRGQDSVFSNRYSPSDGWGTHQPVATHDTWTQEPRVAVDLEDNALATWTEFGGVWSSRLESDATSTLPNGERDEAVVWHRTR
jgi:hypothetical protein